MGKPGIFWALRNPSLFELFLQMIVAMYNEFWGVCQIKINVSPYKTKPILTARCLS